MSGDHDPGTKTTNKNTIVVLVAIEPSNTALIRCCLELLKMKRLANYHFHVSAVTENEEILVNLIALRELHHRLFFHNTDVRCDDSVRSTVQEVVRIEGKIDILGMLVIFYSFCVTGINNANIAGTNPKCIVGQGGVEGFDWRIHLL